MEEATSWAIAVDTTRQSVRKVDMRIIKVFLVIRRNKGGPGIHPRPMLWIELSDLCSERVASGDLHRRDAKTLRDACAKWILHLLNDGLHSRLETGAIANSVCAGVLHRHGCKKMIFAPEITDWLHTRQETRAIVVRVFAPQVHLRNPVFVLFYFALIRVSISSAYICGKCIS